MSGNPHEETGATSTQPTQPTQSTHLAHSVSAAGGHSDNSDSQAIDPYDSDPRAKDLTIKRIAHVGADRPFKPAQLSRIDEALTLASRDTGLLFSVYVGELGPASRATAEAMFAKLADRHPAPVLVAVSPGQRRLEIVTGGESARRIPNRVAALAALAMRGSFANGDLSGGIVTGLRQLADAAGGA